MPPKDYYLPSRRLVSQDDAAIIERPNVPRSRFSGSWTRKTTFDAGYLVPFMVDEILPGDHMRYNATAYVRMATPLFPIFDNQRIDTFFFFVPNRLVWENWARFMGEQDTPGASIAYTIPQMISPTGGYAPGSVHDHFGLPTQLTAGLTISHSALPIRAYALIYNEWFRDQNLGTPYTIPLGDGPENGIDYGTVPAFRMKSHDYFTSALPWPQKFTAPTVPLGGKTYVGVQVGTAPSDLGVFSETTGTWQAFTTATAPLVRLGADLPPISDRLFVDLGTATGVSINTLRQAFLVQQLLERDARGGTRYVEILKSHFGVTSPDFRLQRPEYIGGGQTSLQITPIAQTTPTSAGSTPLGALGAAGTSVGQHSASFAATEHGYIIGLINVRTELSYQQGLARMWSRATRYDFYWPSIAGLGEQSILRKELYVTGAAVDDNLVFGYQEAWHSYRTRYSEITGLFRSGGPTPLDPWHLAQYFVSPPLLNLTFMQDTPPMARVLAAGALAAGQQYLADIMINREAVRPVPAFGTPVTLGRF